MVLSGFVTESGLATRRSKTNKELRLVERKVCFILNASTWEVGGGDACPKANSPH